MKYFSVKLVKIFLVFIKNVSTCGGTLAIKVQLTENK